MTMAIEALNVLAILGFFLFIWFKVPAPQQQTWLWGLAITSVNPIAILFSRNIWNPAFLSIFGLVIFLGHWYRRNFFGSLAWGAFGTLVGQVHIGGFFFQAALLGWTLWRDRQEIRKETRAWLGFGLGTILMTLPLIPWLQYMLSEITNKVGVAEGSKTIFPEFYIQWITSAWGLNLEYMMGNVFWKRFLLEPTIMGIPTYLVAIAHLFLAIAALYAIIRYLTSTKFRNLVNKDSKSFMETLFYIRVGGLGMGLLFSLLLLRVPVYYLNILYPFLHIWIAYLYRQRPKLLAAIVIAQLIISINFLTFVHQNGGIPDGQRYGLSYARQNYQLPSYLRF
jgi:hypothetical protein